MKEKQRHLAIRFNSTPPNKMLVNHNLPDGKNVQFQLISLPFYMIGQLGRLIG